MNTSESSGILYSNGSQIRSFLHSMVFLVFAFISSINTFIERLFYVVGKGLGAIKYCQRAVMMKPDKIL